MHACLRMARTDAVNFITDDRMHLFGIANHGKCTAMELGDSGRPSVSAPKSISEVIRLRFAGRREFSSCPPSLRGSFTQDI